MDNLENWEETLSSKFNEQQFPFDELNWDRAEEQIDAREKARKRKKWLGIYLVGMVSGSLLMVGAQKMFFSGENKAPQIVYVNSNSNPSITNQSTPTNSNSSANVDQNNSSSNSITSNSQSNQSGNNSQTNVVVNNSNNNSHHSNSSYRNNYQLNIPVANNSSNNSIASNVDPQNNATNTNLKNDNVGSDNVPPVKVTPSELPANTTNNTVAKTTIPADTNHTVSMQNKNNKDLSQSHLPAALDSIRHRMNHFIVEIGGNYIMGWYHPAEGRGFNPVGGFVYAHEFNSGYTGTIGIRYEQIGHLEESQKKFVDSNPGFGLNNSSTIIVPSTLRFVSVPFKFEKSFTGNIFGIGANISYLVNTTSRLETWTENDSHQLTIIDTHSESGYLGGFHRWNEAITLSYRRQLLPKFGIQMEATYQLNDLKNNYYFTNSKDVAEHIFGFRAMLTYRIL